MNEELGFAKDVLSYTRTKSNQDLAKGAFKIALYSASFAAQGAGVGVTVGGTITAQVAQTALEPIIKALGITIAEGINEFIENIGMMTIENVAEKLQEKCGKIDDKKLLDLTYKKTSELIFNAIDTTSGSTKSEHLKDRLTLDRVKGMKQQMEKSVKSKTFTIDEIKNIEQHGEDLIQFEEELTQKIVNAQEDNAIKKDTQVEFFETLNEVLKEPDNREINGFVSVFRDIQGDKEFFKAILTAFDERDDKTKHRFAAKSDTHSSSVSDTSRSKNEGLEYQEVEFDTNQTPIIADNVTDNLTIPQQSINNSEGNNGADPTMDPIPAAQ